MKNKKKKIDSKIKLDVFDNLAKSMESNVKKFRKEITKLHKMVEKYENKSGKKILNARDKKKLLKVCR